MSDYRSKYKGQQIDALLDKVNNADTTPTQDSNNLILSRGVKSALDQKQDVINDLATIRSGAAAGATAYQKPNAGIPKTDLDVTVMDSLDKADTAYQKPSGGIPKTDFSADVREVLANAVRLEEYDISDTEMLAVNLQNKILLVSVSDNSISTAVYLLCGTDDSTNTIVKRIHGMIDGDEPLEFYAGTSGADNYIVPSSSTNKIMLAWLNGSSAVEVVDRELSDTERLSFSVVADRDLDALPGRIAVFDEDGNPVDSGKYLTSIEGDIHDLEDNKLDRLGGEYGGRVVVTKENGMVEDSGVSLDSLRAPGISEGIADSTSAGTAQEIVFRKSGGDGVNYVKRFKGKSLVWNQKVQIPASSQSTTIGGITITDNRDGSYTLSGTASGRVNFTQFTGTFGIINGHKYLIKGCPVGGSFSTYCISDGNRSYGDSSADIGNGWLFIAEGSTPISLRIRIESDTTINNLTFKPQLIDITLLGESIITVADFFALFPHPYYEYNAGTLISNDASALETVGFNQWDEEWELGAISATTGQNADSASRIRSKNYIPVFPSTDYYIHNGSVASLSDTLVFYYDDEKNFINYQGRGNRITTTPANCYYIRFYTVLTSYNNDICINLSDASKNGTYEPYWKRNIYFGLTTKEDTDGNVPFPNGLQSCPVAQDEATKEGGTIRVGTRAYQAGDESDANVITDGTNTNYALTTPVSFKWAEPIPNAILCDEDGTEQAIFPTHEDGTPSAPLCIDSNYSISVAKLVKAIRSLNE